jgi:hypothetical protein
MTGLADQRVAPLLRVLVRMGGTLAFVGADILVCRLCFWAEWPIGKGTSLLVPKWRREKLALQRLRAASTSLISCHCILTPTTPAAVKGFRGTVVPRRFGHRPSALSLVEGFVFCGFDPSSRVLSILLESEQIGTNKRRISPSRKPDFDARAPSSPYLA